MTTIQKWTIFIWVACALSASTNVLAQKTVADSLVINGHMRHFKLFLPDNLPSGAPLVFALHGYGSSGPVETWMNGAALNHGFAVCVPVGL